MEICVLGLRDVNLNPTVMYTFEPIRRDRLNAPHRLCIRPNKWQRTIKIEDVQLEESQTGGKNKKVGPSSREGKKKKKEDNLSTIDLEARLEWLTVNCTLSYRHEKHIQRTELYCIQDHKAEAATQIIIVSQPSSQTQSPKLDFSMLYDRKRAQWNVF